MLFGDKGRKDRNESIHASRRYITEGRPAELADDKWKEMDDNAVFNLHLALVDSMLSSVPVKKTAKEIRDALVKL